MDNSELKQEIYKWQNIFQNQNINDDLYELAFFKIFIKFERLLSVSFERYVTGQAGKNGILPKRKLNFIDDSHLKKILKCNGGKSFVEHIKIIRDFSDCFFDDASNPFDIIKTDPIYSNIFSEMVSIRNFIAHESNEAREKYIKTCLGNRQDRFKPVYDYLKSMRKNAGESNYTFYIKAMDAISVYVIEPTQP